MTWNERSRRPWTMFYHMYFPPYNEDESKEDHAAAYQHAADIAREQLNMVGHSFATTTTTGSTSSTSFRQDPPPTLLYYTVIGEPLHNQTWMQVLCRDNHLECVPLPYHVVGQEDVTLQALYEYCHAFPSQSVIYLHTKGSFHSAGPKVATQDIWRQRLTEAATHRQCLEAVALQGRCETCSLLLQPLPGIHYPGNMWTAACSHIIRLLPPQTFDKRMDQVVGDFVRFREASHGRLNTTFFAQMPHMMGRTRFAAEHWLGSHPALRTPCDVSAHVTPNMSQWLHTPSSIATGALSSANFSLGLSPTFPIHDAHWDYFRYGKRGHVVLETPALRLRDYFLLPGQLFKFVHLYQQVPPDDSWIWRWFPDATLWQQRIQQYGLQFWKDETNDDWLPPAVELVV